MICCNENITNFTNQTTTVIGYTEPKPLVTVLYLIDGQWRADIATGIKFVGANIVIDHGGPATGVVKIS